MSRAGDRAYRLRWVILILALLCLAAGVCFALAPLAEYGPGPFLSPIGPPAFFDIMTSVHPPTVLSAASYYTLLFGLFILTQWLFLLPRRHWAIRLTQRQRSIRVSLAVAALMAGLLTVGLVATILEVAHVWIAVADQHPAWRIPVFGTVWIGIGLCWGIWGAVFWTYWRAEDDYTRQTRLIRALISGSIIEMIVAAPVQAFIQDKDQCYCARGSYSGLVVGGTVLLWAFGPGVVLLFLREKYRREKLLDHHCIKCGYNLRGTRDAGRTACPECGTAISGTVFPASPTTRC